MARGFGYGSRVTSLFRRGIVVVGVVVVAVVAGAVVYRLVAGDPSAEEVVQAFRDEGLEVEEERSVDRESDRSFIPKSYDEQVSFGIPSAGQNAAGRVFTFESQENLEEVRGYFEELDGLFPAYVYVDGNVLVRIPSDVPEDEAERYAEALREV